MNIYLKVSWLQPMHSFRTFLDIWFYQPKYWQTTNFHWLPVLLFIPINQKWYWIPRIPKQKNSKGSLGRSKHCVSIYHISFEILVRHLLSSRCSQPRKLTSILNFGGFGSSLHSTVKPLMWGMKYGYCMDVSFKSFVYGNSTKYFQASFPNNTDAFTPAAGDNCFHNLHLRFSMAKRTQ